MKQSVSDEQRLLIHSTGQSAEEQELSRGSQPHQFNQTGGARGAAAEKPGGFLSRTVLLHSSSSRKGKWERSCGLFAVMHRLRTTVARLRPLTAAQAAQTLAQPRLLAIEGGLRTFQPVRHQNTSVAAEPFLNGTSSNYVEEMYYAWLENPRNVHKVLYVFVTSTWIVLTHTHMQNRFSATRWSSLWCCPRGLFSVENCTIMNGERQIHFWTCLNCAINHSCDVCQLGSHSWP